MIRARAAAAGSTSIAAAAPPRLVTLVLKARLRGGILRRARRGELKQMLPVGFVHDARDWVILDPDAQVQAAVRLFFETFRRTGSCLVVVKEFHEKELLFPRRLRRGAHKGELVWAELLHCRARQIIHNPRHAGAFVFGRTKHRRLPNGKYASRQVPGEQWILLRDVHPGYITWEEYESNLQRVKSNALAWSAERRRGPAREGTALLQGLVLCGSCGERMSVRYHLHRTQEVPTYWCGRRPLQRGETSLCQTVHGGALDTAIADILIEAMTPLAIEVALSVQQELSARQEEADRLRRQTWSERSTKRSLHSVASSRSIPTTAWSRMCWRRTGTRSCARSPQHRRRMRRPRRLM